MYKRQLLDKLHQNIECYRDVELTEDSRMTLGEWLDRWLTEYNEGTVRPGTLNGYRHYIDSYIKPQLGDKQISLISQQDVQRMYRRLKTEAVSYTHLDVYKRQLPFLVRCTLPALRHTAPGAERTAGVVDPVSYTHLDVYNRQVEESS